jgi:hypothetical protein
MSDTVTPLEQPRLLLRNFGIVRDAFTRSPTSGRVVRWRSAVPLSRGCIRP